jgi:inorganic triphosphatase YgiF
MQRDGSVAVDRYISYRRGKDIVSLSVFLLKDQPIETHEFHLIAPGVLLDAGKPVAEIRPTATEAQKQSADSGQAFKDLPSAAAAFDAVLAKITA